MGKSTISMAIFNVFCFETPRRHLRAAAHELWSEGHDQQCLALAALLSESFTIKNGGFHQRKLWISPAKMVSSPSKMVSSPSKMVSSPAKIEISPAKMKILPAKMLI